MEGLILEGVYWNRKKCYSSADQNKFYMYRFSVKL